MQITNFESNILKFPRYRHICACNAILAFLAESRYRRTFSVSQVCACSEKLRHSEKVLSSSSLDIEFAFEEGCFGAICPITGHCDNGDISVSLFRFDVCGESQ